MTSKIDIIQVGYAQKVGRDHMEASGSCCLVRSSGSTIIFDTMGPWEKDKLIKGLTELKIHPEDIDYLVCSHSHPDHIGNNNLFCEAKLHIVGTCLYKQDDYDLSCFLPSCDYTYTTRLGDEVEVVKYNNYQINSNTTIERTPGHTLECISLLLENCDEYGSVALVGDLFECEQDVTDEHIWLGAVSQSPNLQRAHRSRIYNNFDFILPGHGNLFKTIPAMRPIKF